MEKEEMKETVFIEAFVPPPKSKFIEPCYQQTSLKPSGKGCFPQLTLMLFKAEFHTAEGKRGPLCSLLY